MIVLVAFTDLEKQKYYKADKAGKLSLNEDFITKPQES